MNTIPSTFSEKLPSYTVLGGGDAARISGVSAVVLNRAGRIWKRPVFEELEKCGFDAIVSIEGSQEQYGLEELMAGFPRLMFILVPKDVCTGCKINIAAHEIKSPLFFVLWDDQRLSGIKAERINERLLKTNEELARDFSLGRASGKERPYKRFCTVPLIQNNELQAIPTMNVPVQTRKSFECSPFTAEKDDFPTLYPYDAAGVYDRARFIELGGFDTAITNPYWQTMDMGMRAWLWGEEIRCDKPIRLRIDGTGAREEASADESYRRFYLKNLAPAYRAVRPLAAAMRGTERPPSAKGGAEASLPLVRFIPFMVRSRMGFSPAWRLFSAIRAWVKENKNRFQTDSRSLIRRWQEFLR
ncbi:MAG: hypothetical protein LBD20_01490 [Spirochaetaceae bacterium]|jgi:hypothetical protein|nr:hypothetical protein [Spirochaetaceae bacterium]